VSCERCGCDEVNGWSEGEPCPDCERCCCGHNAFAHASGWLVSEQHCYECACPGFTVSLASYRGPRLLPVLYRAEERWLVELRAAWATGRRVALSLERCDFDRMEGVVTRVAASGAWVRVRGRLVPLDRVLALHWPSRLGDSTHGRRESGWAGVGRGRWEPQDDALW
jgi:hypothetical protein